ncbi:MAG: toll/interleukin-1 receptor domain-containing protein [Myxococcota bacterium]
MSTEEISVLRVAVPMPSRAHKSRPFSLFLAYSRRDSGLALRLVSLLRRSGLAVYWDQDILGGANYLETIAGRIKSANLMVALLTEDGAQSTWVMQEMVLARHFGRPRLPIRLGSASLPDGLLLELITTQIKSFSAQIDAETLADFILTHLGALLRILNEDGQNDPDQ